ncbi:PEP-CTERM sorting domain-containing protein [Desulforhabdus sp. TSK]|uniref:PEP-CTERM sorting domain-containing protein n=1 Tax=Desulforhabdus sp. TSK TaxID=2925014 RepID=UPI001FC89E72|nr:PEP-CTERM sorting domain-containing protein [Desulforhabdus sp. TSK]GKT10817.1 hypothetical protein DSTSK_41220 [Desulforhabdus sp. TSK]
MQTFRKFMIILLCTLSIGGLSACREDKNSKAGRPGNAAGHGVPHAALQPDTRFFHFEDNGRGLTIVDGGIGQGDGPASLQLQPLPAPSPFGASEDAKPLYGGIPRGNGLDQPAVTPVPEPPTIMLLALGFGAVAVALRHTGKGKTMNLPAAPPSARQDSRKKHLAS